MRKLGKAFGFLKEHYDKVLFVSTLVLMIVGLWRATALVKEARAKIHHAEARLRPSMPDGKVADLDRRVFGSSVRFQSDRWYDYRIDHTWKPGTEKVAPDRRQRPWLAAFGQGTVTELPLIPSEADATRVARSLADPPVLVYPKEQSNYLLHADTVESPFTGEAQTCDVEAWVWRIDRDGDRIPDHIERKAGMDVSVGDAVCDLDGDGFSNLEEFEWDESGAAIGDALLHPPSVGHLRWIRTQTQPLRLILTGLARSGDSWIVRLRTSKRPVSARVGQLIPGSRFRIVDVAASKDSIRIQQGENDPITLQLNVPPRSDQVQRVQLIHLATRQRSVALLNVPITHQAPSGAKEQFTITQDATGKRLFATISGQKTEIRRVDREEFDGFPSRFADCRTSDFVSRSKH